MRQLGKKIAGAGLCAAGLLAGAVPASAQDGAPPEITDVIIVGSQKNALETAGSAHFIGPEQLEKFEYADVHSIVGGAPGVHVQTEDGYGLRPNISIRGVATERSGRITLLEDNILIAPAPYSAPSAYYFPTAGRMHAVEVLKGPAAITQGPYTIGGALNLVSTPIPDEATGFALAEGGGDSTYRSHAWYGDQQPNGFGFLLETHLWGSDGFQEIDRSEGETGLQLEDYTLKLRYAPPGSRHQVDFKFQYADQDSEQSYLGLTDADFRADPYRRYGVSELDNIETEHHQYILRYQFALSDAARLSVAAYDNEHKRNWFKTEGLYTHADDDGDPVRASWYNVLSSVNRGSARGDFSAAQLQAILDGGLDSVPGNAAYAGAAMVGHIQLRANAREYYSRGVQLRIDWEGMYGGARHEVQLGLRYHEDEEDRLQRNSNYRQVNGRLALDDPGAWGNAGNRVQEAEAIALHVQDRIRWGDWTFTPGLRYEDIDQKRTRYRGASRGARTFRDSRENKTTAFLPGLGVLYRANERWSLLAGAHKGFTAPSNSPGVREEEAINYEFGARYAHGPLRGELIGFYSDYENLLGECTSSSGADCEVGEAFNGDAATVQGVEALLEAALVSRPGLRVPLTLAYTYTDGEFDTDIADTDFFGDVSKGDPLPYIPDHRLRASLGVERPAWAAYLSVDYVDEVCVRASCGAFERTDDSTTVDLAARYRLSEQVDLFGRVVNLTDEEDLVGRHPYGARPNKERALTVGLRFREAF